MRETPSDGCLWLEPILAAELEATGSRALRGGGLVLSCLKFGVSGTVRLKFSLGVGVWAEPAYKIRGLSL